MEIYYFAIFDSLYFVIFAICSLNRIIKIISWSFIWSNNIIYTAVIYPLFIYYYPISFPYIFTKYLYSFISQLYITDRKIEANTMKVILCAITAVTFYVIITVCLSSIEITAFTFTFTFTFNIYSRFRIWCKNAWRCHPIFK